MPSSQDTSQNSPDSNQKMFKYTMMFFAILAVGVLVQGTVAIWAVSRPCEQQSK